MSPASVDTLDLMNAHGAGLRISCIKGDIVGWWNVLPNKQQPAFKAINKKFRRIL